MIDFAVNHRPSRPSEWHDFLLGVYNASAGDESSWLEWKSSYNWENADHLVKLSRQILGMANRQPSDAAPYFDGSGIIIVGLEPGTVHGVTEVDPSVLEAKLKRFVGADDGPRWDLRWLKLHGREVLIVEVAAPRIGDPPFVLQSSSGDLRAGQIFVRSGASTSPATQAQMLLLAARSTPAPEVPVLGIHIAHITEGTLPTYSWTEEGLEALLREKRAILLEPLFPAADNVGRKSTSGALEAAGFFGAMGMISDGRSKDEYLNEVNQYLSSIRASFPGALYPVGAAVMPVLVFTATNVTERNYKDVRVTIRVEGDAAALDYVDSPRDLTLDLPDPPRLFGPKPNPVFGGTIAPFPFLNSRPAAIDYGRREIRNGGSFELDFDEFDLRPHEADQIVESDIVMLIPNARREPVIVNWTATASNVDTVARGTFEMRFDGTPIDLLELANRHQ